MDSGTIDNIGLAASFADLADVDRVVDSTYAFAAVDFALCFHPRVLRASVWALLHPSMRAWCQEEP